MRPREEWERLKTESLQRDENRRFGIINK